MNKLLTAYRAAPTYKNAQKLRAYDRSHMMASAMLDSADRDTLADAIHHANRGE
jgi:hypothetical protein